MRSCSAAVVISLSSWQSPPSCLALAIHVVCRGTLTRLDMWSRLVEPEELAALQEECAPYHGDLIAWADMYRGLRGQIQISELDLCRSCPEPEAPSHGDIRVEGKYGQSFFLVMRTMILKLSGFCIASFHL